MHAFDLFALSSWSEPFGLVPYEALYHWRGRPSPCARYDDPGLFEHRGLACTWRADCTVVRSGGSWRWGDAEREAFVEARIRPNRTRVIPGRALDVLGSTGARWPSRPPGTWRVCRRCASATARS